MIKILFLCHGNICRSPMAEFVMKELVRRAGRTDILVESAALHADEIGNDIHRGTREKLREMGIPFAPRAAWLLNAAKAREYDYLVGMDAYNIADLRRLVYPEDLRRSTSSSTSQESSATSQTLGTRETSMQLTTIFSKGARRCSRRFRAEKIAPPTSREFWYNTPNKSWNTLMYAYDESVPMWEKRMLAGRKPMPIVSYYPEIGRGNIDHDFVSHDEVERQTRHCDRMTLWERLKCWLDLY